MFVRVSWACGIKFTALLGKCMAVVCGGGWYMAGWGVFGSMDAVAFELSTTLPGGPRWACGARRWETDTWPCESGCAFRLYGVCGSWIGDWGIVKRG